MDSFSNTMRVFQDDDDEDDEELCKGEPSSGPLHELTDMLNEKSGELKKRPSTPRSKHSATEQRRRSKINDRFQLLRDLIPHSSDQKRDKASFLLEVIEYVRFLQEKVEKYESVYPTWGQETGKLIPWRNNQGLEVGARYPSHDMKNGITASGFMLSVNGNDASPPPAMPAEFGIPSGGSFKSMELVPDFVTKGSSIPASVEANMYATTCRGTTFNQPQETLVVDSDSRESESQAQWLRSPGPGECTLSNKANEHDELMIDEGTISVSTVYSHGVFTKLSQALHASGIDLSQANVSVQINLGKRGIRRPAASTPISITKDQDEPLSLNHGLFSRIESCCVESMQALKRHRPDNR